ncbi:response regulator [Persicitalea sp.]|uniref:response regulator n=1 Tax=Persicitalea sp. TaxID=3100273 RepID=UPI00359427B5
MKVVIIEDEVELGQLISNFLRRKTAANIVKTATTLHDGLLYIDELRPDLVFLDNNLPDGKGINAIGHIKEFGDLQIIMMSAMTNLREEAIEKGVDFFMDKPISFVEIQRILNDHKVRVGK